MLLPEIDRLLGDFWIDDARVLLMYESDGTLQGVEIDVERLEVIRRVPLPEQPAQEQPAPV